MNGDLRLGERFAMKNHSKTLFTAACAAFLVLGVPVKAQETGNVHRGHVVARHICAACHAVDQEQRRSPSDAAPPFVQIANAPAMTPLALGVALQTSHKLMPNIRLTKVQRSDAIAYILSLKQDRPRGN